MAATNNYKCTWVMSLGRQGWEEVWYWVGASPGLALAAMQAVTPSRIELLNPLVSIDQLKVSDEAILGDSLPDYSWQGKTGKTTANLSRDTASNSLLGRAFSVTQGGGGNKVLQYQRPVELSGLPDEWITYSQLNGAPFVPGTQGCPPQFLANFNTWVGKMLGNGFCIKALDKAQPLILIKNVFTNPNTLVAGVSQGKLLVWAPAHGLTSGSSFRIKGARFLSTATDMKGLGPLDTHGKSLVNRVHQFQDITQGGTPTAYPIVAGNQTNPTDWLQLAYDLPTAFGILTYVGGGNVQARVFAYPALAVIPGPQGQPIGPIIAERFNSRDRGRARFTPRGRARKRVC